MKTRVLLLFCLLFTSSGLWAQDVTGKWYGQADLGNAKLRIVFDIETKGEGYTAKMQSPDQSGDWIPVESVSFSGDTIRLSIPKLMFSYTGRFEVEKGVIEGAFMQMGRSVKLDLSRSELVRKRPQEPKPPYPYEVEEVVFRNEDAGINLAGTLTLPSGGGTYPAVVLVTGSGPQDRDETLMGHKPFWVIADYLTRNGIAVLRYDERGVAASEGDFGTATIADFASDALCAVDYLRTRDKVRVDRVGLIGHSEGGCSAFMLASQGQLDFIVSLAGPGISGSEVISTQQEAFMRASGTPDFMIRGYVDLNNRIKDAAVRIEDREELRDSVSVIISGTPIESNLDKIVAELSSPVIRSWLAYDPADYYSGIKCPVLALNGEKDLQVLHGVNLAGIRQGLAHNPDVVIRSYPDLNHLFQHAVTGLPAEYMEIEETVNVQVLKDISDWILGVTR